ncbi:MAG: transketolase C-terminal domain-containing protein [Candidatus Tritonobacter lacicola]|nr:transketolase C-terminal domain-containing protein [Candidatus Tritonobacter lacicola]
MGKKVKKQKSDEATKRWVSGMRDAFSEALYEIICEDERVILITSDTGAVCHDLIKANFPGRYINVGIAEQNMVGVAAGLAMTGYIVYIYAIVPFVTMRCYEQIRVDLCCMGHLPVTAVGVGAGFDYNTLGPTHHGTEDLSLMRTLPGMTVLSPSDSVMAAAFARISYELPGPKYIRLDRTGLPLIYDKDEADFSAGLTHLREGKDVCIVATGRMVKRALSVAEELAGKSVSVSVVDLYRLKPLNRELLLEILGKSARIATIEEHFITGGIGSLVAELMAENCVYLPLKRFGIPDDFCREYGPRDYLHSLYKLDLQSVARAVSDWVKG